VSTEGPFGGGNPFEGMPIFGDLAKLFMSAGPLNLDVAKQMAVWIATEGQPEPNVEPLERIRLEELGRVAEMHVADATGLETSRRGSIAIVPVTRTEWANRTLTDHQSLLEGLAGSLAAATPSEAGELPDELTGLLGNLGSVLGPMLMGFQAGSMVGHLAGRALGQYGFPIPRPPADQLLIVPRNLDLFASDWSLPIDDLRMWLLLEEITTHAVLRRDHVRTRLEALLRSYVAGFRPDPSAFETMLGGADLTNMQELPAAFADPETLFGAMQTDEQRRTQSELETIVTALTGYIDHILDTAGRRLVGSHGQLSEAMKRRRVERGDGDRFVERMFGLELSQTVFDRGERFASGVVERAGEDGLARLWRSDKELPTPAELDAPGLWLERIDIPDS
jgi:putative hydrolase